MHRGIWLKQFGRFRPTVSGAQIGRMVARHDRDSDRASIVVALVTSGLR